MVSRAVVDAVRKNASAEIQVRLRAASTVMVRSPVLVITLFADTVASDVAFRVMTPAVSVPVIRISEASLTISAAPPRLMTPLMVTFAPAALMVSEPVGTAKSIDSAIVLLTRNWVGLSAVSTSWSAGVCGA